MDMIKRNTFKNKYNELFKEKLRDIEEQMIKILKHLSLTE
jgi:hypothetical protein